MQTPRTTKRFATPTMARRSTATRGVVVLAALLLAIIVGPPRGARVSAQLPHEQSQQSPTHTRGGRKVGFNIQPKEGPASGGTLVTLHMNAADVPLSHAEWWCSFGDKSVPAQSYFMIPSEQHGGKGSPALLCVAPAGPVRGEAFLCIDTRRHRHSFYFFK